MFNIVSDRLVADRAYPALAQFEARPGSPEWSEFVKHWPWTVPGELIDHCQEAGYPVNLYTTTDDYPQHSYYLVAIGWWDHTVDYFSLMSDAVLTSIRSGRLLVLFYYHEGDDPAAIKLRLDHLCSVNMIDTRSYRFVSANTLANSLDNSAYFPDHELLFRRRNGSAAPLTVHTNPRRREFTVLSRTHKWWRATIVADLLRNGLLDRSYWSYNTVCIDEARSANPIKTAGLNIDPYIDRFLAGAPYACDSLTADQHNDHTRTIAEHYTDSYCHIVLETLYDAAGGAFLTEKTYKPIKHGQPFVIAGAPGTLQALREQGYRTFDSAIDNAYDLEQDNTRRWHLLFREIARIQSLDMQTWFDSCREDIEHNQRLFTVSKYNRLNRLDFVLRHFPLPL